MTASLSGVTVRYRDLVALNDVSVRLTGGTIGLVGENGAGKTTFLKLLSGAMAPTAGVVEVPPAAAGGVALMPQTPEIIKGLSTLEFVTYLTWLRGVTWAEASTRAWESLVQVRLEQRAAVKLGALSGGMQRRVWLAQALAARPALLLLDEPSTGLDPRQRDVMVDTLGQLSGQTTIVLSSHILEDVAELADRVLVLAEGQLTFDGEPPTVLDNAWFRRHSRVREPET